MRMSFGGRSPGDGFVNPAGLAFKIRIVSTQDETGMIDPPGIMKPLEAQAVLRQNYPLAGGCAR